MCLNATNLSLQTHDSSREYQYRAAPPQRSTRMVILGTSHNVILAGGSGDGGSIYWALNDPTLGKTVRVDRMAGFSKLTHFDDSFPHGRIFLDYLTASSWRCGEPVNYALHNHRF